MIKKQKIFYSVIVFLLLFGTTLNPLITFASETPTNEAQQAEIDTENANVPEEEQGAPVEQLENTDAGTMSDQSAEVDSQEGNPQQPGAPNTEQSEGVENPLAAEQSENPDSNASTGQSPETDSQQETEEQPDAQNTEGTEKVEEPPSEQDSDASSKNPTNDLNAVPVPTSPVDYGNSFITGIQVTTAQGENIDNNTITSWERLSIEYSWALPDKLVKAGDTLTVNLPNEFQFQNAASFNVEDSSGNIVGHAVINPAQKTITVTFTDYASTRNGVNGKFNAWIQVDYNTPGGDTTITLEYSDTTVIINTEIIDDVTNPEELLSKWGSTTKGDPNKVYWTIRVNLSAEQLYNVVLTDVLGEGLEMVPGSFKIETVKYKDGNEVWNSVVPQPNLNTLANDSIASDLKSFEFSLGTIDETYRIRYETNLTKPMEKVDNVVSIKYNDGQTIEYPDYVYTQGGSGFGEGYENANVILKKLDENKEAIISETTKFNLYKVNRSGDSLEASNLSTDANGFVSVENLTPYKLNKSFELRING